MDVPYLMPSWDFKYERMLIDHQFDLSRARRSIVKVGICIAPYDSVYVCDIFHG